MISPVGTSVAEEIDRKLATDPSYREAYERHRPLELVAHAAIMRRAELGLSQRELAERMGTTVSVVSRIESGQHPTSVKMLRRLAEALEGHLVVGFEFGDDRTPNCELVRL